MLYNKINKIYLLIVVQFLCTNINSLNIDSLKILLKKEKLELTEKLLICYNISYYSKDLNEKIKFSKLIYSLSHENSLEEWKAAAKVLESNVLYMRGEIELAIECLLESKEIYYNLGNEKGLASVFLKIGDLYSLNSQKELAEFSYKNTIKISQKLKDTINLAGGYINWGEFYRKYCYYDKALSSFKIAEKLYNQINSIYSLAYAKGNIGLVYTAQNKLDSAEIYLNKSIKILEPLGDNYAVSSYLDGLAEVYFKRKQYSKAKQTAHKSLLLAQEHGLKEQIRDASLRLSTIYNQSKDFEKAFFHHKQYVAYRDSINNEETIRKIANLHTKYEVAQKQKEVDEEKAYKNRYLIIAISAISVLVLLMVLVFIILKISRERRKTNILLEQQRKELEIANATKNKFFSILSHDLRSPLATFHSYAEVIEICSEHNDIDKLLILGKELKSSSANLLDLLDNLLQWGVNQMGTQESVPTTVNLKDVALMEADHLQHVSNKKNIAVSIQIQPSVTLFVDRVKLSIALRNLLNNAIKFTPAGGSVTISAEDSTLHTILKITDTGVGMTKEQKDKLFDFNIINSTHGTQNEKGVGLGMQLVCGFVKENNAKLHVETELGNGTTFTIVFEKR